MKIHCLKDGWKYEVTWKRETSTVTKEDGEWVVRDSRGEEIIPCPSPTFDHAMRTLRGETAALDAG